MQSPSISRRKSFALSVNSDDLNRVSGSSDHFHRSQSGSLLTRNENDIFEDELTKAEIPNANNKSDAIHNRLHSNSFQSTPPARRSTLDTPHNSHSNVNTISSKRRTSRTFETYELLDSSRLSQQGKLIGLGTDLVPHQPSNNQSIDDAGITSTNTTNKDPRHLKQKLLSKTRNSGLLLLGQRVLRDVEVICEGNTRQATLEIALLLGLHDLDESKSNDKDGSINQGTDVDDILNGFDVIWVTELHLMIEKLGLKYLCPDVGNIQTMLSFFTTFNGRYSPNLSNTLLHHNDRDLYSYDDKNDKTLEPLKLQQSPSPIVQKMDIFFSPSPSHSVYDTHDDTVSSNSTTNTTPQQSSTATISGNKPNSTTTISNKVELKNHQHHHAHLHNITTTTTTTQKNALLVTTTTIVDIVDASSSSSSDDDDDDNDVNFNTTGSKLSQSKLSQSTTLPSSPNLQSPTSNSTVIPHTPVVQVTGSSSMTSPSLTLFESTQLLSSPFIKAKSILFESIALHTTTKIHWQPTKKMSSHLVLVSDKTESKMWYMCENHCHLAKELDMGRFEQKSNIDYSEKPTEVKTVSLAAAFGLSSNKKSTDVDSDDDLFNAAKTRQLSVDTSKPSNNKALQNKNNKPTGGKGDKKDCAIM
jgi:hypothetical protein